MKKCNKCGIEKEFFKFRKRKDSKDGYRNDCTECRKNTDKNYYSNNKDRRKIINKKNQIINKEKYKITRKIYIENNKEILNIKKCERRKKQRIVDPLYKLKTIIRASVTTGIKNKGYSKKTNTYKILGCSYEEFKIHIEAQFESWMNWNNHGVYTGEYNVTWQLDHILPISFSKNEEDVIKLNHYTNFQPLCSRKNLEKSNHIL